MACTGKKHVISNVSQYSASVSYKKFSDGSDVNELVIAAGTTATLYYLNGTFRTAFPNAFQTVSISNLPIGCVAQTTTTTTQAPSSQSLFAAPPDSLIAGCYGTKRTLKNISNKIAVVSYNRFSDNYFVDEQQIQIGETAVIWYIDGTYYTAFVNELQTLATENLPLGCDGVTPTPSPTISVTPGLSPTNTPTPTKTPTATPSVTLTPSVSITATPSTSITP